VGSSAPRPYYEDGSVTIYHGDCREILPTLEPFDLLATDPPYGIGERWSKSEMVGTNGSSRLWGKGETWDDEAPVDAVELAVSLAPRAIVWGGNYFGLPAARGWLVWDKQQRFTGADAELAWTNLDMPVRVFRLSRIDAFVNQAESVKEHPTEKPIQLMRWCLLFAPYARTVVDPFMGSGTTLRAAKDLGKRAVGIELEERYCEIAANRCAQEALDLGDAA
jgi:DNA modification methylase